MEKGSLVELYPLFITDETDDMTLMSVTLNTLHIDIFHIKYGILTMIMRNYTYDINIHRGNVHARIM